MLLEKNCLAFSSYHLCTLGCLFKLQVTDASSNYLMSLHLWCTRRLGLC